MKKRKGPQAWAPKVGEKVWLPANPDEGWVDEIGTITDVQEKDSKSPVFGIQLDKKYITEEGDDGIRETGIDGVRPISEFKNKSKNKSSNQVTKTKKAMKKVAKKSATKVSVKSNGNGAKKTAKKATAKKAKAADSRPAAKRSEGDLTRKEASEKLKISIYAVDQALLKKELKSLSEADVMKYKKSAK